MSPVQIFVALAFHHELLNIERIFTYFIFYCSKKDFGLVLGVEKDDTYKVNNLVNVFR